MKKVYFFKLPYNGFDGTYFLFPSKEWGIRYVPPKDSGKLSQLSDYQQIPLKKAAFECVSVESKTQEKGYHVYILPKQTSQSEQQFMLFYYDRKEDGRRDIGFQAILKSDEFDEVKNSFMEVEPDIAEGFAAILSLHSQTKGVFSNPPRKLNLNKDKMVRIILSFIKDNNKFDNKNKVHKATLETLEKEYKSQTEYALYGYLWRNGLIPKDIKMFCD